MKNIISLRNHLFDTLLRLSIAKPEDIEVEKEKAIQIVSVAHAIIKTAEVENQFIALTKGNGSGFIPLSENEFKEDVHTTTNKSIPYQPSYKSLAE